MKSYWMQMTETDTFLECRDTQPPEPGPQQLLVRMHAAGLNRGGCAGYRGRGEGSSAVKEGLARGCVAEESGCGGEGRVADERGRCMGTPPWPPSTTRPVRFRP